MSESNRHGDCFYTLGGEPMFTGCRMSPTRPMPLCAHCGAESTRLCHAAGGGRMGRCGIRLCETHTTRVGPYHDLCRDRATSDHLEALRRGETAQNVWWEIGKRALSRSRGPNIRCQRPIGFLELSTRTTSSPSFRRSRVNSGRSGALRLLLYPGRLKSRSCGALRRFWRDLNGTSILNQVREPNG